MKKILFQGDSVTDTLRSRIDNTPMGFGYPHLVAASLGLDKPGEYAFYNRGVGGNRVIDLLARVKLDIIALAPDYMSILVGVNDVWHDLRDIPRGVDAEKYELYYDLLIKEIKDALPNVKIMIMEPFILKYTETERQWEEFRHGVEERSRIARRIADKYELPFIELQSVFDEAAKTIPVELLTQDGVHPTPVGHELIKREWLKGFEMLKST